jgi:elongation factor P
MAAIAATQMKVGMVIEYEKELWRIMTVQHITPGNWRGMVQTKMRNVIRGNQTEHRFGSSDKVERAQLDQREMEFLYNDGEGYHFMDTKNYEQIAMSSEDLGDVVYYLLPNTKVEVEFYEEKPLGVELPKTVDLKVIETEPGMKGATAANSPKPAKLETGLKVSVPNVITTGEVIRIDTAPGPYIERAK